VKNNEENDAAPVTLFKDSRSNNKRKANQKRRKTGKIRPSSRWSTTAKEAASSQGGRRGDRQRG